MKISVKSKNKLRSEREVASLGEPLRAEVDSLSMFMIGRQ